MSDAVERSIADLRWYFAMGSKSSSKLPSSTYGKMGAAAEHSTVNPDYFRKARVFAAIYTPQQLERLFERFRDTGYVLGWTKMMLLLGLSVSQRRRLVDKAIAGKWSKRRLAHAIREEMGPRAPAGAGRPVAVDDAASEKLREAAKQFDSYIKAIRSAGTEKTLGNRIRRSARKAEAQVEHLLLALNRAAG